MNTCEFISQAMLMSSVGHPTINSGVLFMSRGTAVSIIPTCRPGGHVFEAPSNRGLALGLGSQVDSA